MYILVDYDNIELLDRKRGLNYLALQILSAVGLPNLEMNTRADFRLYGGWYDGSSLSRRAQELSAEIEGSFPTVQSIGEKGRILKVRMTVKLATSMTMDPTRDLVNTYRPVCAW